MKQKIIIPDGFSFEQLHSEIEKGGRFITYSYVISILLMSFNRLSSVHLVLHNQPSTVYKTNYNLITKLFGWWAVPRGVVHAIKSLKINNSGGIDVTNDIMLNMNESSFKERFVTIEKVDELFMKPDKYDKKEFQKVLTILKSGVTIDSFTVGLFLNTGEFEPNYVVGITSIRDFDKDCIEVKAALYKVFRKYVPFDIVNLTGVGEDADFIAKLIEQGEQFN